MACVRRPQTTPLTTPQHTYAKNLTSAPVPTSQIFTRPSLAVLAMCFLG